MIEVKDLFKGYDGSNALCGLSMSVPKGSVYGLVGPNGAGKSTLLRCMSGVYQPESGSILIDGAPVWENPSLKARIAYIPDDLYYFVSASLNDLKKFYKSFYPTFDAALFEKLAEAGVDLTRGQKLWYARMARTMGAAMRQEYPSTPDEAFATGNDGAIYGSRIAILREQGRIGADFAYNPAEPLYTAWDLGLSDHTAIWLVQNWGGSVYWLNHYAANQLPLEHYADKMHEWERQYGPIAAHFLPHDAAHRDPHGQSYVESLAHCGITAVRVVPRTPDVWRGINALRGILSRSWFHKDTLQRRTNLRGEEEPSGLACLEMYRTAPPGAGGTCREAPLHDAASHSADAARMFAEALTHGLATPVNLHLPPRRARM